MAVVHIERCCLLVFPALSPSGPGVDAESVAGLADCLYLYNGPHGGIVFGPGIADEFDALDVCRFQLLQFSAVSHLAAIDIDDGRTFPEYFILVVFPDDARHMAQHVAGSAQLAERRMLHVGDQSLVAHLVLGHMAFHGDAIDGVFSRLELKGADVAYLAGAEQRLVADEGAFHDDAIGLRWDDEVAVLIAHATTDERGVGRAEQ